GATRVGIWCSRVGKKGESRLFCGTLGVGRIRFENYVFDLRGITCSDCDLTLRRRQKNMRSGELASPDESSEERRDRII
ncbi:unnamed protein product, partial [Musa textilis]